MKKIWEWIKKNKYFAFIGAVIVAIGYFILIGRSEKKVLRLIAEQEDKESRKNIEAKIREVTKELESLDKLDNKSKEIKKMLEVSNAARDEIRKRQEKSISSMSDTDLDVSISNHIDDNM